MSDVRPFAALRYARPLGPRLAGPYDVISAPERERLAREPENIVHLTLPPGSEGERDYESAARCLERWVQGGVLVRDPRERIYRLEQQLVDGRTRRGILVLLRLADLDRGSVLPHENTMPGPKLDRLLLTRAVRANLEPLFFSYEDPEGLLDAVLGLPAQSDLLAAGPGPEGDEVRLYAVDAPDVIAAVRSSFAERPLLIADGHHRYETLLRYRDECRPAKPADPDAAHEFALACLVNAFDPGSELRAIHRTLAGEIRAPEPVLQDAGFQCERRAGPWNGSRLVTELGSSAVHECAFALTAERGAVVFARRPRGSLLDVEVLHREILPRLGGTLSFDADADRVFDAARAGDVRLAIFLNAIAPEDLFRVIRAGRRLPRKSTFFTPKVPSGVVIAPH